VRRLLIHTGSFRQELYLLGLFLMVVAVGTLVILNPADAYIGPGLAFDQLGLRLAVGLGFGPTAVVAPLYPFYLSFFYGWIGYSHQAVLLSQVLLLAGATSAIALIVRYLGLSPRYAWLAGALFGLFPQSLALLRHFSPTLLILLLWVVAIHVWIRNRPHPSWFEAGFAGLLFGSTLLGRFGLWIPIGVLLVLRGTFPRRRHLFQSSNGAPESGRSAPEATADSKTPAPAPAAAPAPTAGPAPAPALTSAPAPAPALTSAPAPTAGGSRGRWRIFLRAVFAGLIVFCTVTPWIVRNSRLHGELVFVDSTWAMRWRAATIPGEHTIDYVIPGRTTRVPDHMPVLSNRLALGEVVGFASAEPGKTLRIWSRRAGVLVGFSGWNDAATLDRFPYEGPAFRIFQALVYGLLLSLASSWFVLLRARGRPEALLAKGWLGLAFVGIVTGGIADARILSLAFLVPLAMRGLWGLLVQLRVRLRPRESDPVAGWSPLRAYPNDDPWPTGVEAATPLRWAAFILLVVTIWAHGLSGLA